MRCLRKDRQVQRRGKHPAVGILEVDDESKRAVTEQPVTVDATKVAEEKEEGEVSLWADVGGEETL